jgi:hypothetical protein
MQRLLAAAGLALALWGTGCSNAPVTQPPAVTGRTYPEIALLEHTCMTNLQAYLTGLQAPRMDTFFSAALNGLLRCEASSGLAHVPTKDITHWLTHADGRRVATKMPKSPLLLAVLPTTNEARVHYQRVCVAYMRRYVPASIANAGDDPDVAAAFTFNALEDCDTESGFPTIEPRDLAAIMQAKHLL